MPLSSNKDLYDYLQKLAVQLKSRGASELGTKAESTSRMVIGNSTEFLGESRITLRRIIDQGKDVLSPVEQAEIEGVLRQLTAAINRWPIQPNG